MLPTADPEGPPETCDSLTLASVSAVLLYALGLVVLRSSTLCARSKAECFSDVVCVFLFRDVFRISLSLVGSFLKVVLLWMPGPTYDPSRPCWLLGGTLRLHLVPDPREGSNATKSTSVCLHTHITKQVNLLRDYRPTFDVVAAMTLHRLHKEGVSKVVSSHDRIFVCFQHEYDVLLTNRVSDPAATRIVVVGAF